MQILTFTLEDSSVVTGKFISLTEVKSNFIGVSHDPFFGTLIQIGSGLPDTAYCLIKTIMESGVINNKNIENFETLLLSIKNGLVLKIDIKKKEMSCPVKVAKNVKLLKIKVRKKKD